jgi:undecaprenyl diphosphate synthase
MPEVDLLVRTGGEQRVSNFLLWQIAYAEIVTTDRMWPDFGREPLENAIAIFQERERRFGRTSAQLQGGGKS